jgi:hypothetical protein
MTNEAINRPPDTEQARIAGFFSAPIKMVSYRDVQHLRTPHKSRKSRKSRKGKGRKTRKSCKGGARRFRKGSASKTHPGRKDFTTKRGNKYFDRGGHRYRFAQGSVFARLPYLLGLKRKSRKGRKGRGRKSRKSRRTRRR